MIQVYLYNQLLGKLTKKVAARRKESKGVNLEGCKEICIIPCRILCSMAESMHFTASHKLPMLVLIWILSINDRDL